VIEVRVRHVAALLGNTLGSAVGVTNFENYSLGPLGNISTEDYDVDQSVGGGPWYSVSDVTSDSQYLFQNDYHQVTQAHRVSQHDRGVHHAVLIRPSCSPAGPMK
jgi:hypothetical protein